MAGCIIPAPPHFNAATGRYNRKYYNNQHGQNGRAVLALILGLKTFGLARSDTASITHNHTQ